MNNKSVKGSMISGNPAKELIIFAIPMILGNLFQQFYNIADSVIVGKFLGPDALAAVGASNSITTLFVMVAIGTGIGCSVIISQCSAPPYERCQEFYFHGTHCHIRVQSYTEHDRIHAFRQYS